MKAKRYADMIIEGKRVEDTIYEFTFEFIQEAKTKPSSIGALAYQYDKKWNAVTRILEQHDIYVPELFFIYNLDMQMYSDYHTYVTSKGMTLKYPDLESIEKQLLLDKANPSYSYIYINTMLPIKTRPEIQETMCEEKVGFIKRLIQKLQSVTIKLVAR